jgi:hypothetical protein
MKSTANGLQDGRDGRGQHPVPGITPGQVLQFSDVERYKVAGKTLEGERLIGVTAEAVALQQPVERGAIHARQPRRA